MKLDNLREILRKNEAPRIVAPTASGSIGSAYAVFASDWKKVEIRDNPWYSKGFGVPSFLVSWRKDAGVIDVTAHLNPKLSPQIADNDSERTYAETIPIDMMPPGEAARRLIREAVGVTSRIAVERAIRLSGGFVSDNFDLYAAYDEAKVTDVGRLWHAAPKQMISFRITKVAAATIAEHRWKKL